MSEYSTIELRTTAGTLRFTRREPGEEMQCGFCSSDSDQTVALRTTTDQGAEFEASICANCLAKGLAIAAGNSYVSADGDVEDLRYDQHEFTDSANCIRCGRSALSIERDGGVCSGRPI